ncbi:sigma-70 family RNA polymerase sigma factor [uncultured Pseudokineococcus sp.]|uniref:sigma-70 family RNA polymerase sigma factor n=1 Tax=uncultured Pseudokineococcus sp. TaxID=1642928 RepID=UPI00261EDE3B|nr:sigma-70 family RNA polymerase sigma factor [uncultured Pseudokineococcus sp.]
MIIPTQRTAETARSALPRSSASPRRDAAAVEALVTAHLPLVGHVVREVAMRLPAHVDTGDLAGAGAGGLLQAARGYDEETGVPFARYASTRIRGAVLDELRVMDLVSRGARSRGREMHGIEDSLTATLGRRPSRDELAGALGVGVAEVDRRRAESGITVSSLDAPLGGAGDGGDALTRTWAEGLADDRPGPEELLLRAERMRVMGASVAALPERLRRVVVGTFLEQRPLSEVAEELGVTESRVSQLRTEALGLLRSAMESVLEPQPVAERPAGVAARRREAFYADVALHAAAAGVGSAGRRAEAREELASRAATAPAVSARAAATAAVATAAAATAAAAAVPAQRSAVRPAPWAPVRQAQPA